MASQPDANMLLTADERAEVVGALADTLEEGYILVDEAPRMAVLLRRGLSESAYAGLHDPAALAERLTRDVRGVYPDKHLRVSFTGGRPLTLPHEDEAARRAENFGLRRCEVLDGNIGYLRLDALCGQPAALRTASAALAFLEHCAALIFDLRENGGGAPEMINHVTSYMLAAPTHLNSFVDRAGRRVYEGWTLADVPGRRFDASVPVYVLIGRQTFSGGEEFCYNLQALRRATLVGEPTAGGAHPARPVRLRSRFWGMIPYARAENPITRTNWERVGVQPDVAAGDALAVAVELARKNNPAGRD